MQTKRVLLTIFMIVPLIAFGQSISVSEFSLLPTDLTALNEATKEIDDNGIPCALIKVETTQKGFSFDGGTMGIVKVEDNQPGEIWVYVPAGLRKITIRHKDLGVLRDYYFDITIESSRTYLMKLETGSVVKYVKPTVQSQYLVISVEPKDAMVEIDDVIVATEDGIAMKNLPFGKHTYRVTSPNYHPEIGVIELTSASSKTEKKVTLVPAFGWIKIADNTTNKGASVYIDSKMSGHVPFLSEGLASGVHDVRVVREKYLPFRQQVEVKDGETSELLPVLVANFSSIPFKVDNEAEIWTNNEKIGQGDCTIDLTPGEYIIETRLPSHITQSKAINVQLGVVNPISLPAPIPIYGMIDVSSRPLNSPVYLDGKQVGTTPLLLSEVLVGQHFIQVKADGKENLERYVDVKEGETVTVTESLKDEEYSSVGYDTYKAYSSTVGGDESPAYPQLTYSDWKYHLDGKTLSRSEVASLYRRYCPTEYSAYRKADAADKTGSAFVIIGGVVALAGFGCLIPESTRIIGVGLLGGGAGLLMVVGLPLKICYYGKADKIWDDCMKAYNNRYNSARNNDARVDLNFQISQDGLGLALRF